MTASATGAVPIPYRARVNHRTRASGRACVRHRARPVPASASVVVLLGAHRRHHYVAIGFLERRRLGRSDGSGAASRRRSGDELEGGSPPGGAALPDWRLGGRALPA